MHERRWKEIKEEDIIEILKILGLSLIYYFKNMVKKNISKEFRLKNIDKIINYFFKDIEQNE